MVKKLLLFFAIMLASIDKTQFLSVRLLGTATKLGWSGTVRHIAMSIAYGIHHALGNMPL